MSHRHRDHHSFPTRALPILWWTEARAHVGEVRTIQGTVIATRPAPAGATLLELGQAYPDPTGVELLLSSPAGDVASLRDRKSTRLNSSHQIISYAVYCL